MNSYTRVITLLIICTASISFLNAGDPTTTETLSKGTDLIIEVPVACCDTILKAAGLLHPACIHALLESIRTQHPEGAEAIIKTLVNTPDRDGPAQIRNNLYATLRVQDL